MVEKRDIFTYEYSIYSENIRQESGEGTLIEPYLSPGVSGECWIDEHEIVITGAERITGAKKFLPLKGILDAASHTTHTIPLSSLQKITLITLEPASGKFHDVITLLTKNNSGEYQNFAFSLRTAHLGGCRFPQYNRPGIFLFLGQIMDRLTPDNLAIHSRDLESIVHEINTAIPPDYTNNPERTQFIYSSAFFESLKYLDYSDLYFLVDLVPYGIPRICDRYKKVFGQTGFAIAKKYISAAEWEKRAFALYLYSLMGSESEFEEIVPLFKDSTDHRLRYVLFHSIANFPNAKDNPVFIQVLNEALNEKKYKNEAKKVISRISK